MKALTEDMFCRALEERHGAELQKKFSAASVAICGLGGLGSNIAIALVRAGIGRIHLIDFDRVDVSNLNRQQYFADQLGMYKTDALCSNLMRISPVCEISASCVKLCEENIPSLLKNDDIICEAFDDAEEKAMLVNTVLETFPEKYLIAAAGMAGLSSANSIKTKKVTKRFYICGDGVSDVGDGMCLFSSRVMLCAAHQAHMILRLIAGEADI